MLAMRRHRARTPTGDRPLSVRIITSGSILDDPCRVIVCPVCTVPGVMGKGLAYDFAVKWPVLRTIHAEIVESGWLAPGGVRTAMRETTGFKESENLLIPGLTTTIIFAATKSHFMYPSQMPWIDKILDGLVGWALCESPRPAAIALPALGCGLGGLPWDGLGGVRNVVTDTFLNQSVLRKLPDLEWRVYAPQDVLP